MKPENLQALLQKYIEGRCTPDEAEAVQAWYNSFDRSESTEHLTDERQGELRTRMMSRVWSNISLIESRNRSPSVLRYLHKVSWRLVGAAAMLIIVAGYFFMHTNDRAAIAYTAPAIIKVNNLTKTIQKVRLNDGSIVWLNPQSVLEYPEKFSGPKRKVKMLGEAFFEISHDKMHPFMVTSGKVITRVIGTSFRIRANNNIPTEVSVITGKVSVQLESKENSEVFIIANQKAVFMKEENILKTDSESRPSMRIWHKADMNFDNHSIRTVIAKLNKTFAVNIRSSDDRLLDYVLTADFNSQNLPSILEMLSKSLNITYEITDHNIVLNPK